MAEGFDGVEAGGLPGGPEAEGEARAGGDGEADDGAESGMCVGVTLWVSSAMPESISSWGLFLPA